MHHATKTRLSWNLIDSHGAAVLEFQVLIKNSNDQFVSPPQCEDQSKVVPTRLCDVDYYYLRDMDYPLYLGNEIIFKVRARNTIGWSEFSTTNSVADIVKTEPLAPLTEIEEGELTDDSQVHIRWFTVDDPQTGYDEILSYEVYWDNGSSGQDWVLLIAEFTPTFTYSFVKPIGVNRSWFYMFKYLAVNQHGEGDFS